jgi:hypothetical protein
MLSITLAGTCTSLAAAAAAASSSSAAYGHTFVSEQDFLASIHGGMCLKLAAVAHALYIIDMYKGWNVVFYNHHVILNTT